MVVLAVLGRGVLDPDEPVLHADDLGLTRGDGCFEGCRLVSRDGAAAQVDQLEAHLSRLAASAAALGIDFDEPAWRDLIEQAVTAWGGREEAALRLVLTRGRPGRPTPTGLATITALPADYPRARRDGLRVITLTRGTTNQAYLDAPWLLGGVKTLSYAVNMAAQREAGHRGADDTIFVSTDGTILESPTSTVLWARGDTLFTPPSGPSGILAGTTVARLFDRAAAAGWGTRWAPAVVEDLHEADVLWLIGSVRGPVEVIELDGQRRPRHPELDAEIRRLAGF